jgi:hypothetical protein
MRGRIKWQTPSLFYSYIGKVAPVHIKKACRRSRGIAPDILKLGAGWRWSFCPGHFTSGKEAQYPFRRRVVGLRAGLNISRKRKSLVTRNPEYCVAIFCIRVHPDQSRNRGNYR